MKTVLKIAITLLVLGLLLVFLGTMMSVSWGGSKVEEKSLEFSEEIDTLIVEELSANLHILPSTDGKTHLEYRESEFDRLSSRWEEGTLRLSRSDLRPWYRRFFNQSLGTTTIYLPEGRYQLLELRSISGDVTLEGDYSADEAKLHTISGNQEISGLVAETFSVYSVSGDFSLSEIRCGSDLRIETTSGDLSVQKLSAGSLSIKSISGDCVLTDAEVAGELSVNTTSGVFKFEHCDAKTIDIESVSGDVLLSLKTPKRVETDTVSGKVNVSDSDDLGERCRIDTVSGNITVKHSK